jgi:hypothetical protein
MSTQPKRLLFNPRTHDLKEFETLAAAAKKAGFTHIFISDLSERTPFPGSEKDCPWCEWAAVLPSLFKHVTPPGLEDAYPAAWVKKQMTFMKAKHKIVAKLGMKAAYYGTEPHFLSEAVYRKHPQWRGSRTENTLRATGIYFAPNTDHPEVREAYRLAMKELVKQCPLLEIFTFNTNDSGGFYPWEKRLFNGINGPTGYEGRDMGIRVRDFLRSMRQGALDLGRDVRIFTNVYGWFVDDEVHLVLRSMEPGLGVNGRCPGPHEEECSHLGAGGWGGSVYFVGPYVDKEPGPLSIIAGARNLQTAKAYAFSSGGNAMETFEALKIAMSMPPATNRREQMAVLVKMAEEMYGREAMDDVVDAWLLHDEGHSRWGQTGVSEDGTIFLRWLTRPLVAHQELLTKDERSYWEPYIYQSKAAHPDRHLDYLNRSGYQMVTNWEEAGRICCAMDAVSGTFENAAQKFESAAKKAKKAENRGRLIGESFRMRTLKCLSLTVRQYLQMGTLIYIRDEENRRDPKVTMVDELQRPSMPKGNFGSQGLWFMNRALRWELDNTYELIDLMKKSPVKLFYTAPHPSLAGPLVLESNLLENLERKVDIMLKHWRNTEIGWYKPTYGG